MSPTPASTDSRREVDVDVRVRLMDAAERLVALHGSAGVSVRAIIHEAGQRHNSAITYHFGTRRALMDAVWDRGSRRVNDRRRELLGERGLTAGGPVVPLTELVEIYIDPFARHLDQCSPSHWARFNEEALREYPLDILPMLRTLLSRYGDEIPLYTLLGLLEAMQELTLGGRQPAAGHRVSSMVRMVISTFAAWEREAETGSEAMSAQELGRELRVAAVALLEASP